MKTLVILFVISFNLNSIAQDGASAYGSQAASKDMMGQIGYYGGSESCDLPEPYGIDHIGLCDESLSDTKALSCGGCEEYKTAKRHLTQGNEDAVTKETEVDGETTKETSYNETQSIDGIFRCEAGEYAQDYVPCKDAVTVYNASIVAEKALATKQQVDQKNLATRLTQQAQMDAQTGNIQGQVFNYDIERLEKLKAMETEKFFFYTAQSGAIGTASIAKWPTTSKVVAKCIYGPSQSNSDDSNPNKISEEELEALSEEGSEKGPLAKACTSLIAIKKNLLYKNKSAKQSLLMYQANIGQKIIMAQQQISQYDKQIDQLKNYKDNAFAQDGSIAPQGYSTLCQNNPNDPSCQLGGGRPDLATFGEAGMNFQQGTGGNFGFEGNNPIAGNTDTETNNDLAEGLESILGGPEGGSGSSKPIDAPRAAKNEPPTAIAGGGGGSGGGGGGASAPSITPEGEAGTAPKEAKKDLQVASFNPYGKGKKRGIRIFSGSSKKKDNKYSPKNILSKLTSKKRRSVASMDELSKDIGLFKKISGRYAQLSKEKQIAMPEKKSGK